MKIKLSLTSYLILTFLTACQSITPTITTSTGASIPFSNDVIVSLIMDASDGMDEMSACLAAKDNYRFAYIKVVA